MDNLNATPHMKTYTAFDNGPSGGAAVLLPDDTWLLEPVKVLACGKEKLLDIEGNLDLLRRAADAAGGVSQLVVVCEQLTKNPLFGARGNFAQGRHAEFWRVLLTMSGYSFAWVSARIWQRDILRGIAGTDTKKMARLFLDQRFPEVKLEGRFNAEQREGIRDAMCIALWARMHSR